MVRLALAFVVLTSLPAWAGWNGEAVLPGKIPDEIRNFIEPGTQLISLDVADLNGDGRPDYLLVLEKQKKERNDKDIEEEQRPLLIVIRQDDGSLETAKKSDKVVYCSTCGGAFGDPLASISAETKSFTVSHYGGSALRWSNSYKFSYSKRDKTWQLVRVEEESFHAGDPDRSMNKKILTPPHHYGKIDISEFDPEKYVGMGAK